MIRIGTSVVQIPEDWAHDYPDRRPEIESLGHECILGDDPDMADVTLDSEEAWEIFLMEMEHPSDFRQYVS